MCSLREERISVLGIQPDFSMYGQILNLKLEYFSHILVRHDSLGITNTNKVKD